LQVVQTVDKVTNPAKCLCAGIFEWLSRAFAFISKDLAIAVSYKMQFSFQFTQVFFSSAVIYFIGKMFAESSNPTALAGYDCDYFAFALIGLAVTSYMRTGLVTITNDLRQVMNQGTLEAMCATPVGYNSLLVYAALWPFLFETIRVAFYFITGMAIFGMRLDRANWFGAVLTLMLTIPIFLMLGVISSSILVVVKRGDPINWIFSSASALLAGTMFPVSVFPGWLRMAAACLPLTHSLEAMRKCLLAGALLHNIRMHLLALLTFDLLLLPVSIVTNRLCMQRAKRRGVFTTH